MATLKELLKGKILPKEISMVPSSFDIIGTKIVFSHFPLELKKKQDIIGKVMLGHFPQVSSIFKKSKKYSGKYRTPKLTLIAGNPSKETAYKEHNTILKFDIERVYFSPRLSNERKRIFEQVKAKESVLCLFSGCGVYPLTIAKNARPKDIYGIELNPLAHQFAMENVKLNKLENKVTLFKGDVRRLLPKLNKKFDRILMPLPKDAEHFLDVTLPKLKKRGIVHFYCFGNEEDLKKSEESIKTHCQKLKRKCRIIRQVICGHFGPKIYRWCIDFRVS